MTYRAVDILKKVDLILCEDTRSSQVLLKHYQIDKPLKSYHQFNTAFREDSVIEDLKKGHDVALISDAGTPGICDPGHALVLRCQKENIPFTALPGACSAIMALILSGFSTEKFQFIGFLHKKISDLKVQLSEMLQYSGTSICFETPHRILDTLELLITISKDRRLCVLRELTKIYEESLHGTARELFEHFTKTPPRGEIILLMEADLTPLDFSALTPEEHVAHLQENYGLTLEQAIKNVARLREVPKREIYRTIKIQ